MSHDFQFKIERVFDAPRERVWKAWTDEVQLKEWFGPKGCPIFYSKMDLRVGGNYLYGMKAPDGSEMWGKWVFKEIAAPERLVMTVAFSDKDGKNVIRHPWNNSWPLQTMSTTTFTDMGDKTKIVVVWQAYDATDEEEKTFKDGQESMNQGWSGTFEQLETYLASQK